MIKIIIGIIGRYKEEDNIFVFSKSIVDVITSYNRAILGIVPNQLDTRKELSDAEKKQLYKIIDKCDGIILQGGAYEYNYDFDAIRYINSKNMPLLGICLGMQCMALATGGKIREILNHDHVMHNINVLENSKLFKIINEDKPEVNSRHKYSVEDPGEYKITAYSKDMVVEAIEKENSIFNIGVQWHPENMSSSNNMKKLFNAFFNACNQYHNKKAL